MNEIQLLAVKNESTRRQGQTEQELSFFMLVDNLAFRKRVEVVWAGENGVWQSLPAKFHRSTEENREYWLAKVTITAAPEAKLPGDVQFALRYEVNGQVFWDNGQGRNYRSRYNSGIRVAKKPPLLNVGFDEQLDLAQERVPVSVAVDDSLNAEKVAVHWTTDDWRSTNTTRCCPDSSRGNSKKYGVAVWEGLLDIGTADRLEYCINCEAGGRVLWDNNRGRNYRARRRPLNVLVLNLHCCQEENQDAKFSMIARAINERNVDIVCLQEVAEPWNDGAGDWSLNSANIINQRLPAPFHIAAAWSHLGFDRYREGVAILSRYPFSKQDARYVSRSEYPYDINARRVVMAQIDVPGIGPLNVFSCHLSWWDGGFEEQIRNLLAWAGSEHAAQAGGTLLCGDFNIKAGSRGYEMVVDSNDYEDQFLAANSPQVFNGVFRERCANWQRLLADDGRIDFVFMKKSSALRVTSGRELFTEQSYGRVSDHTGYLLAFKPR